MKDSSHQHVASRGSRITVIATCMTVLAGLIVAWTLTPARSSSSDLPAVVRLTNTSLTGLALHLDRLEQFNVWQVRDFDYGPEGRANRYQLEIRVDAEMTNSSRTAVDLASNVRLLVAYPDAFAPTATYGPKACDCADRQAAVSQTGTPPADAGEIYVTSEIASQSMTKIENGASLMRLPPGYEVWAVPAQPAFYSLRFADHSTSMSTWLDENNTQPLTPGERHASKGAGRGWVYNVPIGEKLETVLSKRTAGPAQQTVEQSIVFVGLGVFDPGSEATRDLLGFAPMTPTPVSS